MSAATPVKGQTAPSVEIKTKSALPPVAVFDTPLAKAITVGRPVLLLAACYARLSALIKDPVSTLQTALPVVVLIQVLYAVLCLPAAGSQNAKPAKKARPGEKKKHEATGPNLAVTTVLALVLTAIATPALHILFVLFGAPFLAHIPDTLLCAAHFATLAAFPIFYTRGVDSQAMLAVAGATAPLDEVFGGLLGAVLGAWLGAVPIPLDWDREWQRWPVTIVVGMYMGYAIGSKGLGTVFYGKRLAKTEEAAE